MLEVSHKYLSPIANVDSTHGVGSDIIERYSQRLYNWYVNNPNFYTGDIVVIGHPDYRLGNRLLYRDTENHDLWEYYIESVQHSYSYVEGYKTTLGVTRGLRIEHEDDDGYRFLPIVGPSEDFEGGYFGEGSIADAISASEGQGQDYLDADTGRGGMGNMQNDSRLTRPAEGLLTSPYGMRLHPIHDVMRMHNGVDIAGGSTVIKAMASGVVTTVTNHKSLGRFVEIDHGNLNGRGKVTSLYAHLEQMHVHVGKQVTTGEQIGVMGTTGDSTGVHLHFELHVDGKRKDPEHWFKWTHA